MPTSSRFACANHLLALLALTAAPLTSETMARSVHTNPVVVRRILGSLRAAGLVASPPAATGAWRLQRPPSAITLCEVFRVVENDPLLALHAREPNNQCPVGRNIHGVLAAVFKEAHQAMEQQLGTRTIADVLEQLTANNVGLADVEQCARQG